MASAAVTSGGFSYIDGTRDRADKSAYVARVPAGRLDARWSYWNGRRWSPDAASAQPIAAGVSDQFSVVSRGGAWRLVTQVPMKRAVVVYSAATPAGPWSAPRVVARVPAIANAFTYNATLHPELSVGRRMILGYNVNALDLASVYADAGLYKPRFMEIDVG
jgi:Domain of unknown function (DUF4185)